MTVRGMNSLTIIVTCIFLYYFRLLAWLVIDNFLETHHADIIIVIDKMHDLKYYTICLEEYKEFNIDYRMETHAGFIY